MEIKKLELFEKLIPKIEAKSNFQFIYFDFNKIKCNSRLSSNQSHFRRLKRQKIK